MLAAVLRKRNHVYPALTWLQYGSYVCSSENSSDGPDLDGPNKATPPRLAAKQQHLPKNDLKFALSQKVGLKDVFVSVRGGKVHWSTCPQFAPGLEGAEIRLSTLGKAKKWIWSEVRCE
jgi:hypothetical protein